MRGFLALVGTTLLATAVLAVAGVTQTGAATPMAPDLGMARLSDVALGRTADGRTVLRFSATVVNVGTGPFVLHAERPDSPGPFAVMQRTTFDYSFVPEQAYHLLTRLGERRRAVRIVRDWLLKA